MTRLRELDVLLLDCQATGASPDHGSLLEIGWARVRASEPPAADRIHAQLVLLPLGESIPDPVARLTGLGDEDLHDATTAGEAWALLRRDAKGVQVAVIHYARFEESFLRPLHHAMAPDEAFPFDVLCSHAIARRLWPDLPRCGLRAVAGFLGYPAEQLRRSAAHVGATAHLWRHIVLKLRDEHAIDSLDALRQWLERPVERSGLRVYPMPREKRLALPDAPGVYKMLRSNGDVLYIGKATSLRRRVNGYFQKQSGIGERTLEMLSQARDVEVLATRTGLEAALLEADEIKRHAPPYNVALRGTGRSLWYAAPGFSSLAPEPSVRHRIGPLSSAWWPTRYASLLHALGGSTPFVGDAVVRALVAALGRGADEAEPAVLLRGMEELRHRLPPGAFADDRTMMRFGALRWAERQLEAAVPDCDDPAATTDEEVRWDLPRVVGALEDLVLVVAHGVRRASWLRRLSESSIAWSEPGRGAARHVLVLDRGRVHAHERIAPGALPPLAPGVRRSRAERIDSFDLATYDRLRVLTTEVRRMISASASVEIRLDRGRPLSGTRLQRALAWV